MLTAGRYTARITMFLCLQRVVLRNTNEISRISDKVIDNQRSLLDLSL